MFFKGRKMLYISLCFLGLLIVAAGYLLNEAGKFPSAGDLSAYEGVKNFAAGKFWNTKSVVYDFDGDHEDKMNMASLIFMTKHAPEKPIPQVRLNKEAFPAVPEDLAVYWLGHASAILEIGGKRLGTDLVFGNASPVPFTVRRYQDAPLKRRDLPKLDYILLTHNHYDHLERATVRSIKEGVFIVPLGLGVTLKGWGIAPERIVELDRGDVFERDGVKIRAVEGIHFSGRSLWDADKTSWNSYIISAAGKNVFWGGDSGYGKHYAEIGEKYGPFDFAALEIDAWNGGWPDIHLFPEQAVRAAKDLKAKTMLPIHWSVYDLGFHPWDKSIKRVAEIAEREGMPLATPKQGEKYITEKTKTSKWWEE